MLFASENLSTKDVLHLVFAPKFMFDLNYKATVELQGAQGILPLFRREGTSTDYLVRPSIVLYINSIPSVLLKRNL